jgi:hypothetical protein
MKRWERSEIRRNDFMTRTEVVMKAIEGKLTWLQAADIVVRDMTGSCGLG